VKIWHTATSSNLQHIKRICVHFESAVNKAGLRYVSHTCSFNENLTDASLYNVNELYDGSGNVNLKKIKKLKSKINVEIKQC